VQQQQKRQGEKDEKIQLEIGKSLVQQKCTMCHDLDRVFDVEKNKQEWTDTVGRMMKTTDDTDFISEQEKKDIVQFLSGRGKEIEKNLELHSESEESVKKSEDRVKTLISLKCSAGCHALDRVLRVVGKSKEEWLATVNSMVEMSGDPHFLSEQEKKDIVQFLINREPKKREESGVRVQSSGTVHPLVSSKCSVCHDLDRVQGTERNKEEWTKIVNTMVDSTGDPNYLSKLEKEKIINIISGWGTQKE
jgi:hypothetical protein